MRKKKDYHWLVKAYDMNGNVIRDHDILRYAADDINKGRKKYRDRESFSDAVKSDIMYHYWSKAEWELILHETDDGRILLLPWCGCRNPEGVAIDVTDDDSFDWKGFADFHTALHVFGKEAKIDVYDQIAWRWEEFIDYLFGKDC